MDGEEESPRVTQIMIDKSEWIRATTSSTVLLFSFSLQREKKKRRRRKQCLLTCHNQFLMIRELNRLYHIF